MSVFNLESLAPDQRAIIEDALARCTFPFDLLKPGLQAQVGRDFIPVEFADLSRWSSVLGESIHVHVHDDEGNTGHILGDPHRKAALGLAWYSGKVSVEASLVAEPELAKEVFLSEGAHMIDFFYMTPEHRQAIYGVMHPGDEHDAYDSHGHGWFEETGNEDYWSWVGESFMGLFVLGYSDVQASLLARQPWAHRPTAELAAEVRSILTPPQETRVGVPGSTVYHKPECFFMRLSFRESVLTPAELQARRPCRWCKPA